MPPKPTLIALDRVGPETFQTISAKKLVELLPIVHVEAVGHFMRQKHRQRDLSSHMLCIFDNGLAFIDIAHVRHLTADKSMEISFVIALPLLLVAQRRKFPRKVRAFSFRMFVRLVSCTDVNGILDAGSLARTSQ